MHFSVDMIWLDANKKVVHIAPDVSPNTFPHQFCPGVKAQYEIELNGGVATRTGIRGGQTLNF